MTNLAQTDLTECEDPRDEPGPWFPSKVAPVFRPLWRGTRTNCVLKVETPLGIICGLVAEMKPGIFAWQIEFDTAENRGSLGDFMEAPPSTVKALVERGIMELISNRGGRWTRP